MARNNENLVLFFSVELNEPVLLGLIMFETFVLLFKISLDKPSYWFTNKIGKKKKTLLMSCLECKIIYINACDWINHNGGSTAEIKLVHVQKVNCPRTAVSIFLLFDMVHFRFFFFVNFVCLVNFSCLVH